MQAATHLLTQPPSFPPDMRHDAQRRFDSICPQAVLLDGYVLAMPC